MPSQIIAEDDDGIRLDRWFQRHAAEVTFNIVSRWSKTGAVRLDDAELAALHEAETLVTLSEPSIR
jgi:23S rRNA pseudouridine955/2504/2580 synthase